MKHASNTMLKVAIMLIVIGLIGTVVSAAALVIVAASSTDWGRDVERGAETDRRDRADGDNGRYSSNGERIFFTGVGHEGPIPVDTEALPGQGMRDRQDGETRVGCAYCHGADGRGRRMGMMGRFETPDIRFKTLATPRGDEEAWTEADIARAVRDGIEPDGSRLRAMMPRWQMDDEDMSSTIDYLKELN